MVEFLSKNKEPLPEWLDKGEYNFRNFFDSRTVFYPGSGADGHPLAIFNPSHSAHCYFFVDQDYPATSLTDEIGNPPIGYGICFNKQYSPDELIRECAGLLPENALELFGIPATSDGARAYGGPPPPELQGDLRASADAHSAVRLIVYERASDHDENHGAKRFAVFCLGMEARTAYEWFYGSKISARPPYAILLQDHGFGGDFAAEHLGVRDGGFGDPDGFLYRAARANGLPEFLIVVDNTTCWRGYERVRSVDPSRGGVTAGFDRSLYRRQE